MDALLALHDVTQSVGTHFGDAEFPSEGWMDAGQFSRITVPKPNLFLCLAHPRSYVGMRRAVF